MDILRRHIFEIHLIDLGAVLHIVLHPGRGNDIVQRQRRILVQFIGIAAFSGEHTTGGLHFTQSVHFRHLLHHFKEPGTAGNAISFQAWRYRKTDGLFRPALISDFADNLNLRKIPANPRMVKGTM